MKAVEYKLKQKLDEVFLVAPNELGNNSLTIFYRQFSSFFKSMPFIYLIPLSIGISVLLYLLFGYLIVRLVSILQYGF